ncbi:hypothetical protein N3K66_003420 [Trichothecium roseum]|uniref:Uncharacterized protein n=1 Tax=Trichothecium roseum TaxID=47278 RepID=A0ACC0V5X2_9HYPO|nr:hypothetical protein N3K66_003420 [Trichothecium roseum]
MKTPLSIPLLLAAAATAPLASGAWIVPGARWLDTDGNRFNAHAGGMYVDEDAGRFYWYGEYKTTEQPEGGGVSVYSSDDLATWEYHGLALEPEDGHEWISPHNVIQRPKVQFSQETGQYHMWWHADNENYTDLAQGLAVADDPRGPFTFHDAVSPLGNWSQDYGLFTDHKDGRSYALYSNGDSAEGRDVYVARYRADLAALDDVVFRFDKFDLEAPTIVQTERYYYALMSHKTGYRPNNVVAFQAESLEGPWSMPFMVSPPYTRTYSTQSGFSLRIKGTKKTSYLYMGDTWDMNSHYESRNTWLPMEIDDDKGTLQVLWHDVFDLNVKTGEWNPVKGKTYSAKDAQLTGNVWLQRANFAESGVMATGIYANDSKITFEVQGAGEEQWVAFYHQNIDDMGFGDQPEGKPDRIGGSWQLRRISSVIVNGDADDVHTLYQRDTHKGIILSTPLKLPLKKGKNTLTVGGLYNGVDYRGADLEKVVVYPPEGKCDKWWGC